jgi:hypothetical protein
MKLNRKKLSIILPQIKAHLNVAVIMDTPKRPGFIDFIFQPKSTGVEFGYLNRLTCSMSIENDLFADSSADTLGSSLIINLVRLRDAMKNSEFDPELKDGVVNGVNIQVDVDNLKSIGMGRSLSTYWTRLKDLNPSGGIKFVMPRIDYELMAKTVTQFVSQDTTRIFMCGYNIDFSKGEDFINFVATDGRKMTICKFPYNYPKMGNSEEIGGDFIIRPLNLFIPESAYSRSEWWVCDTLSLIQIQTEDYSIDCWARPIEGQFPNYSRIIADKDQNKEWISLNVKSARIAFDSVKGSITNDRYSSVYNKISIDAEDPKRIRFSVPGASVDVEGEASRPMFLRISWNHINPAFFDTPFTRFFFKNARAMFFAEESRAVRGTTMSIIKVAMPLDKEEGEDEWGIDVSDQILKGNENDSEKQESENDDVFIDYGNSSED